MEATTALEEANTEIELIHKEYVSFLITYVCLNIHVCMCARNFVLP